MKKIVLDMPPTAPLATAIEVSTASGVLERLSFEQRDDKGNRVGPVELSIAKDDGSYKAQIVAELFGNVEFIFWGCFKDGSLSRQVLSMKIGPSTAKPLEFRADPNFTSVVLGRVGDTYQLYPTVRYAGAGWNGTKDDLVISLKGHVQYRNTPGSDTTVVVIQEDGKITALRPGNAEIEVRFGVLTDIIRVFVKPDA